MAVHGDVAVPPLFMNSNCFLDIICEFINMMATKLSDRSEYELLPQMLAAGWGEMPWGEVMHLSHQTLHRLQRVAPSLLNAEKRGSCCLYHPSKISMAPGVDTLPGRKKYLRISLFNSKGGHGPVREYAHRLVCWVWNGPPLGDKTVARHTCSNPNGRCINPAHLEWGSVTDNCGDVTQLKGQRERQRRKLHDMLDSDGGRISSQQSQ
jgi:hypothetical protein